MKLAEIAKLVDGEISGDGEREIIRARGLDLAGAGDISFVVVRDKNYLTAREKNPDFAQIEALIVGKEFAFDDREKSNITLVRVENPAIAFVLVSQEIAPPIPLPRGIHQTAIIATTAQFGENVAIGAGAIIGERVVIGDRSAIGAGVVIGDNCVIGKDCIIYPRVVFYHDCMIGDNCIIHAGAVIGTDGFGFQWDGSQHLKIPQVGKVQIGNNVEIGANTAIDRARFGATVIGDGCKIDNLVHIAHNCRIGAHSVFAAQIGISGSVTIGSGVIIGGQCGFADHLTIGDGARFFARSGVMNDIPAGALCGGEPAMEYKEGIRQYHNTRYAARHFKELEKRVEKLECDTAAGKPEQ